MTAAVPVSADDEDSDLVRTPSVRHPLGWRTDGSDESVPSGADGCFVTDAAPV